MGRPVVRRGPVIPGGGGRPVTDLVGAANRCKAGAFVGQLLAVALLLLRKPDL